jgi:hypothetical protein
MKTLPNKEQLGKLLNDIPKSSGVRLEFTDIHYTSPWGYIWGKPFSPYIKKYVLTHDVAYGDIVTESNIKKSDAKRFDDSMKGI